MKATQSDPLTDFSRANYSAEGMDFDVFTSVSGATPLIFLHEMPEITPQTAFAARTFVQRGFKVRMPSFVGDPGDAQREFVEGLESWGNICIRREFSALFGTETRPVVKWIRHLARTASAEAGGAQVGVVGMCFTGGFALAAATDAAIAGAVACQPALPIAGDHDDLDIGKSDYARLRARTEAAELNIRAYRFEGDPLSHCERMGRLHREIGQGFQSRCLPNGSADPGDGAWPHHHSVITTHLIDAPGQPTRMALDEIVAFFEWRLRGGPPIPTSATSLRDCATLGCARRKWKAPAG